MARAGQDHQIIWLQPEAPTKPAYGTPCNGCGVCCAASPCPVSRVFLRQWRGACRALEWHASEHVYRCGMLVNPSVYVPRIPSFLLSLLRRLIRRWIAVDTYCDASAEIEST